MEPEFISSVEATTALETPQVLLAWAFADGVTSPLNDVTWDWINMEIRRSKYKFPESEIDGDSVLSEAKSDEPTTNLSDINVEAFLEYYYSLFLQYKEHSASNIGIDHDIKRLGVRFSAVKPEDPEVVYGGTDGSTNATAVVTSANSAFWTNSVEAGFIFEIAEGGADDGFYRIVSVDSETQVTLDTSLTLTISDVTFLIYPDQRKYWIGGIDFFNKPILWRWNSESKVVDFKINLDELLSLDEQINAITETRARTISAADGITSSSSVKTFTSASSTFVTDGVQPGDILIIDDSSTPGDNGFYVIESIDNETSIKIPSNWTTGGLSSLSFIIYHRQIAFITRDRYVRVPVLAKPESTDVINEWTLASSGLTAGYKVTGAFLDPSVFEASDTLFVLDSVNLEIAKLAESNGAIAATIDLSSLDEVAEDVLWGLAGDTVDNEILVGVRNYIYSLDENVGAPTVADVDRVTYTRQLLRADLGWYEDQLTGILYVTVVDDDINKLQTYQKEIGQGFLWQQPFVADANTIGLWHLNEDSGALDDASQYSNDGVNNGMTYGVTGQFSNGMEATGVTDYIDLVAISGEWNGGEGSVSVWFKASQSSSLTSGTSVIFDARVDVNNLVRIGIDSGQLTFEYVAGGTAETIQGAHPSADSGFHCYTITWSATSDEVKAFVDDAQFGSTQIGLGIWVGVIVSAVAGDTAAAALGVYDEVRISDIARVVHSAVMIYTEANRMYAFSGRDYNASYDDDDPLGFHYRDEFFTAKYFGGEYLLRNDYEKAQLHPPNKVITSNQEVVFRGPTPLPELGDLGRTARIFGLFLDRLADDRQRHLQRDPDFVDFDDIEEHAARLGLPGLDTENWNVDKQRRFLKVMPWILKRGGLDDSYFNYARLLGFIATVNTLIAKRRFDSVIYSSTDPYVQAIAFDTIGSFDTWHYTFPLALLRFRFYKRSFRSTVGATDAVPANRLLTDAGATFRDTLQVGSLIHINDQTNSGDNGEYLVAEIHSDTTIKVDQDWPTGGLTGLTYTGNWEVPQPDPDSDFLLTSFLNIAPDSMSVVHIDD